MSSSAAAQGGKPKCPAPGAEIAFAKVMNEAFAQDYVGCDIIAKVEFLATGGTGGYSWDRVRGTEGKAPFRVVVPGQTPGSGELDVPPHVFIAKDKADVIFSFKKGDILIVLIVRGAPSVTGPPVEVAFIATAVRKAK